MAEKTSEEIEMTEAQHQRSREQMQYHMHRLAYHLNDLYEAAGGAPCDDIDFKAKCAVIMAVLKGKAMETYYYKYLEIGDEFYAHISNTTDIPSIAEEIAEEIWKHNVPDLNWRDGADFELELFDKKKKKIADVTVWVDFSSPSFHAEVDEDVELPISDE